MEASTAANPDRLLARVEELESALERGGDPSTRAVAEELLAATMELYGEGLRRTIEALDEAGDAGAEIKQRLVDDGVVASLLLIHDLYPVDLETRINQALDSVRPYLESHGGNVELLSVDEGVARLRLKGSCDGCPASSATLELAIKQALDEHAPDLAGFEAEGAEEPEPAGAALPMAGDGNGAAAFALPVLQPPVAPPSWFALEGADGLDAGSLRGLDVAGAPLVVANVEGTLLAYRDACAGCGEPLHGGSLDGGALACPACGREFDLPDAGRALGGEGLQLEPVPLLREDGAGVRVALAR